MSRFGCFGRAEQKILRTDFLQWKFFFQKVTPSQLSASFVLFPADFEYVFCQVKQPVKCLMEKNSDFYLCYHNSYEIWHSFSRTSMRNFLWCYYRWFITSFALEKCKKIMRYYLDYPSTRLLSTENLNYSFSWWIPSQVFLLLSFASI